MTIMFLMIGALVLMAFLTDFQLRPPPLLKIPPLKPPHFFTDRSFSFSF